MKQLSIYIALIISIHSCNGQISIDTENRFTKSDSLELYYLSNYYNNKEYESFNPQTAFLYLKLSAEGGYHKAIQELGTKYLLADGCDRNDSLAIYWLEIRYDIGYIENDYMYYLCPYYLGTLHMDTKNGYLNIEKSINYFESCISSKSIIKMEFTDSSDISHELKLDHKTIERLHFSEKNTKAVAYLKLGEIYYNETYQHKDLSKAFSNFRNGAELGDSMAAFYTGHMYFKGEGTHVDYQNAYRWTRQSATNNCPIGQYNLGKYYYYGIGIYRSLNKAAYWIQKSYENGYQEAKNFWEDKRLWEHQ